MAVAAPVSWNGNTELINSGRTVAKVLDTRGSTQRCFRHSGLLADCSKDYY